MARWLVTGGSGFIGRHVLATLRAEVGAEVVALGRACPEGWDAGAFVAADLTDPESVALALRRFPPDFVVHAAGRTPPARPDDFYRANLLATLHLLDALRSAGRPVRVVVTGSAAELGPVAVGDLPVGEGYPCRPADAYALSKWLATCAATAARPPLSVAVGRVFNPIGPGQPVGQAFGRFAARLLAAGPGPLTVGGLATRRDFVDVRDVARALIALARSGQGGAVYHVGTGVSHRVGAGLDRLVLRSGRAVTIEEDPTVAPPNGPDDSRADITRIVAETGWRPAYPFLKSLDDLWDLARAGHDPGPG